MCTPPGYSIYRQQTHTLDISPPSIIQSHHHRQPRWRPPTNMTLAMHWFPPTRWWCALTKGGGGGGGATPLWSPATSGASDDDDDHDHQPRRKRQRLDPEVVALERSITDLHVLTPTLIDASAVTDTTPKLVEPHPVPAPGVVRAALPTSDHQVAPSEAASHTPLDAASDTWALASHSSSPGSILSRTTTTDAAGLYLLDESDMEVLDDDHDRPDEFMFYYE